MHSETGTAKEWIEGARSRGAEQVRLGPFSYDDVTSELRRLGVEVFDYQIDAPGFWEFVDAAGYRELAYFGGGDWPQATEKWLEHYVSVELLGTERGHVVVDIAGRHSPFADAVRKIHGATVYTQDLIFPEGIEGDLIGGDACALPLEDGSVDGLTMHCSFEHFEGSADSKFLSEAARVLKPGGRLCILPLYTSDTYSIQTDPETWSERDVMFEPSALVCLHQGWGETHGRVYSPKAFEERVLQQVGDLQLRVGVVQNLNAIAEDLYLRFFAVFEKPQLTS